MLGLVGLTGYSLRLDLLYGWYRFVRMAPHTAAGFVLLGIGIWLTWYDTLRGSETTSQHDGQRIAAIATIILLTAALIASMVGFILSAHRTEAALNQNLAAAHANRSQLLNYIIDNTRDQARALASDPTLLQEFADDVDPAGADARRELAGHLLSAGYSAIVALDATGASLLAGGQLVRDAPITLAMHDGARLLWQSEPVLEVRVPVHSAGRHVGTLVAQRHLPALAAVLRDAQLLGKSGDIALCAALSGNAMRCLPTRLRPQGFLRVDRVRDGEPLPMSFALDGKKGLAVARDYRGAQVVAAYGAIGATGLGLVLKEDGIDLYEPIRTQLETMLALLLLLVAAGLLLLRWQVTPLIAAMLQAKKQARAGEEKVQTVVDNIADGLLTMDESGTITSVNPAAAGMFGYQPDEIIGAAAAMLMPEQMREQHRAGLKRYVAGGEAHIVGRSGVQVVGRRKDGSEFPMQLAVREAQVEGGRIFVGILRDSMAQKAALEISSRFNAFLEATPNLVIFAGMERELLYINSAGRTLLGLAPDEDCTCAMLDEFVDGGAQAETIDAIFPAGAGNAWRGEYTLRSRPGAAVPLLLTVVRILREDDATNSYVMVGVDVSERNRAEDDLRKTLERFRLLSRATNDTVWDWDLGTNEITWNVGIELTYGHAPENRLPSADWWVGHIHPDDVGWVVDEVEAKIHGDEQYWTGEYRFRRADGDYAHVHDRGYIIRDEQGGAVRMIGAMNGHHHPQAGGGAPAPAGTALFEDILDEPGRNQRQPSGRWRSTSSKRCVHTHVR